MPPKETRKTTKKGRTPKGQEARPRRSRRQAVGAVHRRLAPWLADRGVVLLQGDSRQRMAAMDDGSVDCIVTDPPYGLTERTDIKALMRAWLEGSEHKGTKGGFMGKKWDATVPSPMLWEEAFRVLKPGGYCLAFAGSKTQDLTTAALRFAGFEIRDVIMWHYAQGMPKGRGIGRQLGHASKSAVASGLTPTYEPIIVARKPFERRLSLLRNVEKHGTGGLNIDACRIGFAQTASEGPPGRWPTNTVLSHTRQCRLVGTRWVACSAHSPGHKVSGFGSFGGGKTKKVRASHHPGSEEVEEWECAEGCPVAALDAQRENVPSRFFKTVSFTADDELPIEELLSREGVPFRFVPKPDPAEREAGLAQAGIKPKKCPRLAPGKRKEVETERLNVHPTVKPIALMRWLIELVCPKGGVVLDPFNGSGSTGCAAVQCGCSYIGIDLDETEGYLDIAAARIQDWAGGGDPSTTSAALKEAA